MIDYETFMKIRHMQSHDKLSASQIASELGFNVKTVCRWLDKDRYEQRKSTVRTSKLDPFKKEIIRMLERHPYTAVQVFQRITEDGFDGGYTIVKDYVRRVRPSKAKAFLKLSFAPGECAQVDWGSYGSVPVGETTRRLSFFVMVMCCSRMMYAEFTVSQTMEHFLDAHRKAFEFFGGAPRKIMVDNLKSAVLKRIIGRAPVFNPTYLDFAGHYGFDIMACGVGKGNEKGRVENGVGYIKKNFLAGLEISDFSILKPGISLWLDTVANVRNHGETGEKPAERFKMEQGCLTPLPRHPYDIGVIHRVRASRQFRVTLDTNYYSVPAQYAGERVMMKVYPDRLCIYHEDKLIARHPRSYDRRKDFEQPDHVKSLLAQRRKARDQNIFRRFLSLSEKSEEYYRQLEQRRMNVLHHIRQIVALSEIYDPESVRRAIDDAFEFQAFSCEYIANLLEQRSRIPVEAAALHVTRRRDLLDISIKEPDLSIYDISLNPDGKDKS